MIDILNDLSEIHFEVFWNKWHEIKPGKYNRERAEMEWFYMREDDRIEAFTALAQYHPFVQISREPYLFLIHFKQ